MVSKHGTPQRLSKHLRNAGDRQWKDSPLVGQEVIICHHGSREVIAAGKLEYGASSSGFHIGNQQVYLRGIVEVLPKERMILYDPYYSDSRRGEQERLKVNGLGRRIAEYA